MNFDNLRREDLIEALEVKDSIIEAKNEIIKALWLDNERLKNIIKNKAKKNFPKLAELIVDIDEHREKFINYNPVTEAEKIIKEN